MDKPKKKPGPKPKDPNNIKNYKSKLKPDTSPQPDVPDHVLLDDVARSRIDRYESIVNKRKFCKVCKKYRKRIPKSCKVTKNMYYCIREHGYEAIKRQRRKPKSEHKTVCKYCKKDFGDYKQMIGHINFCDLNPNTEERNRKVSESHKGLKHSEETKRKISNSMKRFHAIKTREGVFTARQVQVRGGKKLTIKFF